MMREKCGLIAVSHTVHLTNPLISELNTICHLLALLAAHPILHVSRIRVNFMLYPYAVQVRPWTDSQAKPRGGECATYSTWNRKIHFIKLVGICLA